VASVGRRRFCRCERAVRRKDRAEPNRRARFRNDGARGAGSLRGAHTGQVETDYPTLEETGCKVGNGVATGADKVFARLSVAVLHDDVKRKYAYGPAPDTSVGTFSQEMFDVDPTTSFRR
jgi:hypothetical protein